MTWHNADGLRTYSECARIMSERGHPMTKQTAFNLEKSALKKLRQNRELISLWREVDDGSQD